MRAHVGHGICDVVVRKVEGVSLGVKAKLQDLHAREARVLAHGDDLWRHEAQVLRNDGQLAQMLCHGIEDVSAGTLGPAPKARVRRAKGHGPVGLEATEVVDAQDVVELEACTQALDPPGKAILSHACPVVDGVAPVLTGRGELVGRRSGNARGVARGVNAEELGRGPHLHGVARHVDGDVSNDKDAPLVRVRLEELPVAVEEVLRHLVVAHALGALGAQGGTRLATAAVLLGPLVVGLEAKLLLDRHELAVGLKPGFVCLTEGLEVRRGRSREARQRSLKKRTVTAEERAVVNVRGVVAKGQHNQVLLSEVTQADKVLDVNEVRVPRKGGEGLVGRVTKACGGEGKNLPVALVSTGQKVDEVVRLAAKRAYAHNARK